MNQKGSSDNLRIRLDNFGRLSVTWLVADQARTMKAGMSLPAVKRVESDGGIKASEEARCALQRALGFGWG